DSMMTGLLSPLRSRTGLAAAFLSASSVTSLSCAEAASTENTERAPAPAALPRKLRRVVFMVWPCSDRRFSGRHGSSRVGAVSYLGNHSMRGRDTVRENADKRV